MPKNRRSGQTTSLGTEDISRSPGENPYCFELPKKKQRTKPLFCESETIVPDKEREHVARVFDPDNSQADTFI